MEKVNIVVWDAVGNVMWGVRKWEDWGEEGQKSLLADDLQAMAHAPSFEQLFAGYEVTLHRVTNLNELTTAIEDADFLITHKVMVPAEVLLKGRRLRLVQHLGLDYRGLPMDAVRQLGIRAAATPLINYLAVAEHTMALILNHLRVLPQQRAYMQTREYARHQWGLMPGNRLVRDQTLGLVGFGEIARPVARMAHAFDMKVMYWDGVRFESLESQYGVQYVNWETLWRNADVISLHLPINNATQDIVGTREIGWMKPNALLVNTARGKLVNQQALAAALCERRIGGAALDVFYTEPLPIDDPLHELHEDLSYHVTLTPHTSWQSHWTHIRDSLELWNNVLHVLHGEPITYEV
jgi:phosphoglycerate dehydrogenase-like enzyme